MPRQALFVELGHERIGVELLDVPHAGTPPETFEEHHCANHGWHARRVADALHASLLVGRLVRAVVVDVVGAFLAVLRATDAAADGGLAVVVFTEVRGPAGWAALP